MLKHRTLLNFVAIVLLTYVQASGQELKVVSFDVITADLTARTKPRIDLNGRKCALLKVYVDDRIVEVRGSSVGEVESVGMEKQIYMAHDSQEIELIFDRHFPLKIVFDEYGFPSLTGMMTYVLKLKDYQESSLEYSSNDAPQSSSNVSDSSSDSASHTASSSLNDENDRFIEKFIKDLCNYYNIELGKTPLSDVEEYSHIKREKKYKHYTIQLKDGTEFTDSKDEGIVSLVSIDPRKSNNIKIPYGVTFSSSYKEWDEWFVRHGFESQKYAPYYMKQAMMVFVTKEYELILMFDGREKKQNTLFSIIMCKK